MKVAVKNEGRILIIEDNFDIQLSARLLLKQHYAEVVAHDKPDAAIQELRRKAFDVIILDMNFSRGETSGKEGLHWLKKIIDLNPANQVIMITAYGDIDLAIQALKSGARDFVLKPWENEKLLATVANVYHLSKNRIHIEQLEQKHKALSASMNAASIELIGTSPAIKKIHSAIPKLASTDASLLIMGENGTGKELIARAIHNSSGRKEGPFIKADLRTIPSQQLVPELFGNTEMAGGKCAMAEGGTLYLDEVFALSHEAQLRLMSLLKPGSDKENRVSFRLICSSSIPAEEQTGDNRFLNELLYRIRTLEVRMPALRERAEDIPALAEHFIGLYGKRYNKSGFSISTSAMNKLSSHHWPGNIRELRHTMERSVIMADHHLLQPDDFNLDSGLHQDNDLYTLNLEDLEKDAIKQALLKYRGNITQASRELGLTRSALYRRLEKYGL